MKLAKHGKRNESETCFKSLPTLGNSIIISVITVSGRTLGCLSSSSEELEESSESWSLFLFFFPLSLLFLLRSSFSSLLLRRSFSRRRRRRREERSESDDDDGEDEDVDESCRRRFFFLLSPILGIHRFAPKICIWIITNNESIITLVFYRFLHLFFQTFFKCTHT